QAASAPAALSPSPPPAAQAPLAAAPESEHPIAESFVIVRLLRSEIVRTTHSVFRSNETAQVSPHGLNSTPLNKVLDQASAKTIRSNFERAGLFPGRHGGVRSRWSGPMRKSAS